MRKIFFIIPILLIILFWKEIVINPSDHLYDWNDTLYTMWIIQNNLTHFKTLDFANLYETSAMYPFKYSLSFAEHLFLPSLLLLPLNLFTSNPIFQMNFYLVLNHILIFVSFFLLAGVIVKNFWSKLISSFYVSFSPYIFTQLGHIHMLSFWPLLFSLYFLFKNNQTNKFKDLILSGVFLGLQFTTGAYPGIMGFAIFNLYFLTKILYDRKYKTVLKNWLIVIVIFFLTASVSIVGYYLAKQEHGGHRDIREFLIYSAHLTDYIFPASNQNSLLYSNTVANKWKSFDFHRMGEKAAFVGILPLTILIIYLLKVKKDKNSFNASITLNQLTFFLVFLLIIGFIFSLGPRLHANGQYLQIPLPYYVILQFPFIESLRALARWSFLLFLAAALLTALGLDKFLDFLNSKYSRTTALLISISIFLLFVIEFYPTPLKATTRYWWDDAYTFMQNDFCKSSPAVLEYPFAYRNYDADIIVDLQYKTNILLASTQHGCKVLSGFSGYEPDRYVKTRERLNGPLNDSEINYLKELNIDYIKINKLALLQNEADLLIENLRNMGLTVVYDDFRAVIFRINK